MISDISRSDLDAIVEAVRAQGVTVTEDWNEPEGSRFIGTFEGTHITLFPKFDTNFALYFTVAHLYGHMVQIALKTPASVRVGALISTSGRALTEDEVQTIYEHEREAAAIGRKLMASLGDYPADLDRLYHRIFLADFHYLIHFIETGEKGPDAFTRFLRREPIPHEAILPDPRPLFSLRGVNLSADKVTVV
jgi:hypothetical protein